jgi:hypothetical protein
VGKPEGKGPLGRPRRRWVDNIKMDLREIGQSTSLSWNKAPIWGLRPDINYCFTITVLFFCGALSLTRWRVCLLYMLLALASAVLLWSESLCSRDHILLSHIWHFLFRRLPRLAVEVFDPASTRVLMTEFLLTLYKHSVRTLQETRYVSARKSNRFMPFVEAVAVYCENHM